MSTKQEIAAAASKRFKKEEVDLGGGVKLTLRELTPDEKKELDNRLWKKGAAGKPIVEKGKDGDDYKILNDGVNFTEEWIAAGNTAGLTVQDLLTNDWPDSLKVELRKKVQNLCGFKIEEAAKN